MERNTPDALHLIEQGEAALARGDARGALAQFDQAQKLVASSQIISRRRCQALNLLGEREAALAACQDAIGRTSFGPALGMRAAVAALMSSPKPTVDELAQALYFAQQAIDTSPTLPAGYAANCDIAYRLGDAPRLATCQHELARIAPTHYETARAARLNVSEMPMTAKLLWGSLLALSLFTLVHFILRTGGGGGWRAGARQASRVTLALLLCCLPALARAEGSEPKPFKIPDSYHGFSKWPVNVADPSSSVPTPQQRDGDPVQYGYFIMDLADLAGMAIKQKDYAAAGRLYEAAVKADPDSAVGYRKACQYIDQGGDAARALNFCRRALGAPGVMVTDYVRYADMLLAQPAPLTAEQVDDLKGIVDHLRQSDAAAPAANVECDLAMRTDDYKRLAGCVKVLQTLQPNDPKTISFAWSLAVHNGNLSEAQRLVAEAKKTAMKPEGIQSMEQATALESSLPRRFARNWVTWLGGSLAALGVALALLVASKRRSRPAVS
jgi:tetratricopeptide (TPR) repeat protein